MTASLAALPLLALAPLQVEEVDLAGVRAALVAGAEDLGEIEARWRASLQAADPADRAWAELFGYAPPGRAVSLASLAAFLYAREGREEDAVAAARYLARVAAYRDEVPEPLVAARVEYAGGLPAVPSFFQLAPYAEAWARVRACAAIDEGVRATVEDAVAGSADFVLVFPEWGAHNRAMLRAEGLAWCARALPDHPDAGRWRRMAAVLAGDGVEQWEIEDASLYRPIFVLARLRYAEAVGEPVRDSLRLRFALRGFVEELTPPGHLPAYGDAWWGSSLPRLYACLAWGAAELEDPVLAWGADRVWAAMGSWDRGQPGLSRAGLRALLDAHPSDEVPRRAPDPHLRLALDDAVAKKVVWRTGWGADDAYLCLDYRDEPDWALRQGTYLRRMLAVEHEKTHHGHADEGAVVLWMDRGAVLLHDAGYRETAPSGPHGAWRADVFHNRLVVRPGRPEEGALSEHLLDAGTYRPVRTAKVDELDLGRDPGLGRYARVRIEAAEQGWTADRAVVALDELTTLVVVDSVRVLRGGAYTFAPLWATQSVRDTGDGWALGAYHSIGDEQLPRTRELLLVPFGEDVQRFGLRRHRQDEHVLTAPSSGAYRAGQRVDLVSVLRSVPAGADGEAEAARVRRLEVEPRGAAVALEIEGDAGTWTLLLKTDLDLGLRAADVRPRHDAELSRVRGGGIATDADLCLTLRAGGEERWVAVGPTFVELSGERVFAARPHQVFQTSGRSDVVGRAPWRLWSGTRREGSGR